MSAVAWRLKEINQSSINPLSEVEFERVLITILSSLASISVTETKNKLDLIGLLRCCKSISYTLDKNSKALRRHLKYRHINQNRVPEAVLIKCDTFSSHRCCVQL